MVSPDTLTKKPIMSGKKPVRADEGLGRGETRRSRVKPLFAASHHMISPIGATEVDESAIVALLHVFTLGHAIYQTHDC